MGRDHKIEYQRSYQQYDILVPYIKVIPYHPYLCVYALNMHIPPHSFLSSTLYHLHCHRHPHFHHLQCLDGFACLEGTLGKILFHRKQLETQGFPIAVCVTKIEYNVHCSNQQQYSYTDVKYVQLHCTQQTDIDSTTYTLYLHTLHLHSYYQFILNFEHLYVYSTLLELKPK